MFVSVGDVEVGVARGFEGGVDGEDGVTPCVARPLEGAVKVAKVGCVEVGGGEVGDGAEPPCEDGGCRGGLVGRCEGRVEDFKVAVVGVDGGDARVVGVDDDTKAGCENREGGVDMFEGCVGGAHLFDGSGGEDATHP